METNHLWEDHGDGLAEHHALSLNSSDSPSEDTETVNHGGVGIGSNHGVRVWSSSGAMHNRSQVLEVNLMHDSAAWRDNAEVVKSVLTPLQELESLSISVELEHLVLLSGIVSSGNVDLDGVINNTLDLGGRVDA